jgi:hypothetical protein
MTSNTNAALVHRYYEEALSRAEWDMLDAIVAPTTSITSKCHRSHPHVRD